MGLCRGECFFSEQLANSVVEKELSVGYASSFFSTGNAYSPLALACCNYRSAPCLASSSDAWWNGAILVAKSHEIRADTQTLGPVIN